MTSRLGEDLSPKRDALSPKRKTLRLSEVLKQNHLEKHDFSPERDARVQQDPSFCYFGLGESCSLGRN